MLSLLIDTSTERGIAAIFDGLTPLVNIELPYGYNSSGHLMPALERSLKQSGLSLNQLAFVGVGVGPGSYTGIRIGAIVGKSIAYARKIPLVGVCSLQSYVPNADGAYAVMIDAKISGVYLLRGRLERGEVVDLHEPRVCALQAVTDSLDGVTTIVSPNSARIQSELSLLSPGLNWQDKTPCATQMARSALAKFRRGEFSTDGRLELQYLRKTQAEIERGKA